MFNYDDNLDFKEEWLDIVDYELKILMLTSILAENNLGYRGTLKTMCEWLGVVSCGKTNAKIKDALNNLASNGYIFLEVEGRTYHVSIRNKGMKDKRIIKIRKMWIETIKKYNRDEENKKIDTSISIDWIKILKVFVYLYGLPPKVVTNSDIALALNMSTDSVSKSIKAIENCNFKGLRFSRQIIKDKYEDESGRELWNTRGSDMSFIIIFDEI